MNYKHRKVLIIISILLLISLSCNLPFNLFGDKDEKPQSLDSDPATEEQSPQIIIVEQTTPEPKPVSFQEGFGSLDSYKFKVLIETSSSDGSLTIMDQYVESSVIDEKNHSITKTTSREAGELESYTDTMETYNIGTVTCSYSDGYWEYSEKSSYEKELMDIFSQMVDFVPIIDNPVFIGEETINGIQTNHFQFSVSGIGSKSGAVATFNQGEYFLAVDGQYLVRYKLELMVQSAPEIDPDAEVYGMLIYFDLNDVNVPIALEQPAECVPMDDEDW